MCVGLGDAVQELFEVYGAVRSQPANQSADPGKVVARLEALVDIHRNETAQNGTEHTGKNNRQGSTAHELLLLKSLNLNLRGFYNTKTKV